VLVSGLLMMMFGCCVMTSRHDMSFSSGMLRCVCHDRDPFQLLGPEPSDKFPDNGSFGNYSRRTSRLGILGL
jgi:hypothetical protein